jgi:Na+-transporting NADH:ubiquinone oxidoreductase subunit NqrC
MVTVMTGIFMISTIVAMAQVGIKDPLAEPTLKDRARRMVMAPAIMEKLSNGRGT